MQDDINASKDGGQLYLDGLPPHVTEAEEALIGAIILEPKALDLVRQLVQPTEFYSFRCQVIYQAAVSLSEHGRPCDQVSLATEVTTQISDNGWVAPYLSHLVAGALPPIPTYIQHWASLVNDA